MRKFLNTCATIEKTIAEIYRRFADSIACDEELKAIWLKMAKEEDQHALDIGFAARLPHEGTFRGKDLTLHRAEQLADVTRQVLDKARKAQYSVQEAVDISLALEKEFLAVHIASSVEFEQETMRNMFRSIVQSEEEHCRAIREYHARNPGD